VPNSVGLDTSFVLGLIDEQDLWHAQALNLQAALDGGGYQIYIFDCVLAEVISLIARRTHEKRRAASFPDLVTRLQIRFPTKAITWLYPDLPPVYDDILAMAAESNGELNFNDVFIALSCRKRGISRLASFDADFDRVPWLKRIAQPADLLV
jgi:predicted nucleic acid-binding protein